MFYSDIAGSNLMYLIIAFAGGLIVFGFYLTHPAQSGCAFCSPFWILGYSLPVALIIGSRTAKQEFLAFTPPPDYPLQVPMLVIHATCGEACQHCELGKLKNCACCGCCNGFDCSD